MPSLRPHGPLRTTSRADSADSADSASEAAARAGSAALAAIAALVALAALAACAPRVASPPPPSGQPPEAEAPVIIDRPISFSGARKAMTLAYIRERYGLEPAEITITPRMIVLHWTAIEDLEGSFRAFDRETLAGRPDIAGAGAVNVSIHFLVDRDGTVYRLMPETWMARHVIGLNYDAVGVENVGTGGPDGDTLTPAQVEANIRLVRYLARKYPTIEYLIGHHEYLAFEGHPLWRELDDDYRTVKIDPGDRFMDAVREGVEGLGLEGPPGGNPGTE